MTNSSKLKRFLTGLFVVALMGIAYTSFTYSSGPPASKTNAPNEQNCTQCHTGTALQTSGTNWNNISMSGDFHGTGYIPDSTYNITLKYKHSGRSKFGFQMTCLNMNDAAAGTFANSGNKTSTLSSSVNGSTRYYVRQTSLGNSSNDSISWSFEWTAPSSNVDTVTFYTAIVSANNNGQNSQDLVLAKEFNIPPSSWLPEAEIDADTNIICSGNSVQFYGSSNDTAATYSWSFPTGNPSTSTDQNPLVTFNSSGNRTVSLQTANTYGISSPVTYVVTIRQTPVASIFGSDRSMCDGDSVELRAGFEPGASYLWSNGMTGQVIFVKDTGNYSVRVSKGGCQDFSDSVRVSYLPKPVASLSTSASNDTLCEGSSIDLISTGGFDSFYYYGQGMLLAALDTLQYTTTLDSHTTFGLQVRDGNGCLSDVVNKDIVANDKLVAPIITCTSLSSKSVQFNWNSTFYHDGFEISLDQGDTWITASSGIGGDHHLVSGLTPEEMVEIWVRAFDPGPCGTSAIGMGQCAADTCSSLGLTVGHDLEVCKGDLVTVTVNGLQDMSYSLDLENAGPTTDTILSFQPTISKDYVLLVTDSNNLQCPAEEYSLPILVKTAELNSFQVSSVDFCEGDSVQIVGNGEFDTLSFFWNDTLAQKGAAENYKRATDVMYITRVAEVYGVVVKDECVDTTDVLIFTINALPQVDFSYSFENGGVQFTANNSDYQIYNWAFGDGSTSTDVNPFHEYQAQGDSFEVILKVKNEDCWNEVSYFVTPPSLGIDILEYLDLKAYPNPVEDVLYLENAGEALSLEIYSATGELVLHQTVEHGTNAIELRDLTRGYYVLTFIKEAKSYQHRFLKH